MSENDIYSIAELYNKLAFYIKEKTNDDYFNFKTISIKETSRYLKKSMKSPNNRIIVAEEQNEIIGFLSGEITECFLPVSLVKKIGYISGCYVKENFRNMGISKKMLKTLENYFKEKEVKFLYFLYCLHTFLGFGNLLYIY